MIIVLNFKWLGEVYKKKNQYQMKLFAFIQSY